MLCTPRLPQDPTHTDSQPHPLSIQQLPSQTASFIIHRRSLKRGHFFNAATEAHTALFGCPPGSPPTPFRPPLQQPWSSDFAAAQRSHLTFKQQAREILRTHQDSNYQRHEHGNHYRLFRTQTSTTEFMSDLHNFSLSKTMLRLRSGHSKLAMHDKISDEQKGRCGANESVEHVLLHRAVSCMVVEQR